MKAFSWMALRVFGLVAATTVWFATSQASAQSVTYDFEDGTDQGFGTGFGNDASKSFPIVNIGGSNRMEVPLGGFQVAGRETGNPADPQFIIMSLGAIDESQVILSYDWYVDPSLSPGNYGSFLQLGSYVNTGSGYYAQNFPGAGKEVELDGSQLSGTQPLSGTVSGTLASKGFNIPLGETFFRIGLIENGDGSTTAGSGVKVYFDNIRLSVIPEPASLALVGMGAIGLVAAATRRRKG